MSFTNRRGSILSREWRYKWTKIPKLEFYLDKRTIEEKQLSAFDLMFSIARTRNSVDMHDVHQVLLLRQGPTHELNLYMEDYWEHYDCFELDQIILHLLRNHVVKRLRLYGSEDPLYKLPISVFSLHHLTDLYLYGFDVDHPPEFNGFGTLGSLYLSDVKISMKTLLHLLSNCPSLKDLNLDIVESDDICTINELLNCLPIIECLTIWSCVFQWLVLDSIPQELPTSLMHLKYLRLEGTCLVEDYGLAILLLIKCSPNLKRMELEMCSMKWGPSGYQEFSAVKDDYSDIWLEHLNGLQLCFFSNTLETEFVKFILARSPKLKKVTIFTAVDQKQESKMLKALSQAPRASPAVIITTL